MSQTEDDIIDEVKTNLKAAMEHEDYTRPLNIADGKFGLADSDNGFQWPEGISKTRNSANQPMLTINKVHQHCLQVINDAKQNKVAVKVSATGDQATKESADIYEGLIRHIEYQSQAEDVYTAAVKTQVYMGIGYWRICTDYIDDDSFDQEIYIRPVKDPLSVYLDPDINEADGSDARWGLFYRDISRDQFDLDYPKLKGVTSDPLGELTSGMVAERHMRVVEYYRRIPKRDRLIALADGTIAKRSEVGPEMFRLLRDQEPDAKVRSITSNEVEWFKIAGGKIVSKGKWPSSFIPIVRVPGEESVIDGEYDRRGHVRMMKDPQRMFNYWMSGAVETVALQSKTPWIGPMEAFDGLETYWNQANRVNLAWLPYNGIDDAGKPIAPPQRQEPPQMSPAFMQGMQMAEHQMQMVSGQYDATMGEKSNEKSGIAIQQRQRQGDNATYGYIDSLASAIRYTGRILIDMVPNIYDTDRVIQILAENGDQSAVHIQPDARVPLQTQPQPGTDDVKHIFNPTMGKYSVQADVGPSFGTRRQETFNALVQIIQASPDLIHVAGDIMMRAAEFPMADELADRLKNMVPPQALGGPSPAAQAAAGEIQKQNGIIQKLVQDLATKKSELDDHDARLLLDRYRAETERMTAIKGIDPEALVPIVRQMVHEAMGMSLPDMQQVHGIPPAPPPQAPQAPGPQTQQ